MSGHLYRPCVGVALVNQGGDAFIGHRKRKRGSEILDPRSWQMPQGGIDAGEQPFEAAKRELWEETSVAGRRARTVERPVSRADPEVVSVPVYWLGEGDRGSPSGRRCRRC
jgi:8-oxo-dGTP pyrophosphatase MutT (NUDIX family)